METKSERPILEVKEKTKWYLSVKANFGYCHLEHLLERSSRKTKNQSFFWDFSILSEIFFYISRTFYINFSFAAVHSFYFPLF